MTSNLRSRSSWISEILYKPCPDGSTYIAFLLTREDRRDEPVALLYGGPDQEIPSWLPGLVTAGKAGKGSGERPSPGRVYNRLVKGKGYPYQRVEGREKVRELKELMK